MRVETVYRDKWPPYGTEARQPYAELWWGERATMRRGGRQELFFFAFAEQLLQSINHLVLRVMVRQVLFLYRESGVVL